MVYEEYSVSGNHLCRILYKSFWTTLWVETRIRLADIKYTCIIMFIIIIKDRPERLQLQGQWI